jgi:hypothetical protein
MLSVLSYPFRGYSFFLVGGTTLYCYSDVMCSVDETCTTVLFHCSTLGILVRLEGQSEMVNGVTVVVVLVLLSFRSLLLSEFEFTSASMAMSA